MAGLDRAGPDALTFFANPRYASSLRATRAGAVILGEDAPAADCAMLRSRHPYLAFAEAVRLFDDTPRPAPGVSPQAVVAPDAWIGPDVHVAPFVVVGAGASVGARTILHSFVAIGPGARVGEDCVLHSHVSVRERVVLGDRVVVQNGAVVGSDGYGFARRPDGTHQKSRRSAPSSSRTTSRSAPTPRSTGPPSVRPGLARAPRSTTSCRLPTA